MLKLFRKIESEKKASKAKTIFFMDILVPINKKLLKKQSASDANDRNNWELWNNYRHMIEDENVCLPTVNRRARCHLHECRRYERTAYATRQSFQKSKTFFHSPPSKL